MQERVGDMESEGGSSEEGARVWRRGVACGEGSCGGAEKIRERKEGGGAGPTWVPPVICMGPTCHIHGSHLSG